MKQKVKGQLVNLSQMKEKEPKGSVCHPLRKSIKTSISFILTELCHFGEKKKEISIQNFVYVISHQDLE